MKTTQLIDLHTTFTGLQELLTRTENQGPEWEGFRDEMNELLKIHNEFINNDLKKAAKTKMVNIFLDETFTNPDIKSIRLCGLYRLYIATCKDIDPTLELKKYGAFLTQLKKYVKKNNIKKIRTSKGEVMYIKPDGFGKEGGV